MNGVDYLADTNILLLLLEGNSNVRPFIENTLAVSIISEIELLGWHKITKHEINEIDILLGNCFVIDLFPSIKDIAIELRQKNKLKIPDTIIAATAIYLEIPLLTADKGLTKIKELNTLFVNI
jgi:hypothetical protein